MWKCVRPKAVVYVWKNHCQGPVNKEGATGESGRWCNWISQEQGENVNTNGLKNSYLKGELHIVGLEAWHRKRLRCSKLKVYRVSTERVTPAQDQNELLAKTTDVISTYNNVINLCVRWLVPKPYSKALGGAGQVLGPIAQNPIVQRVWFEDPDLCSRLSSLVLMQVLVVLCSMLGRMLAASASQNIPQWTRKLNFVSMYTPPNLKYHVADE